MPRTVVTSLLVLLCAAAQRRITIDNIGTETWQCAPAGSTDTTTSQSRFSDLDPASDHLLTPTRPTASACTT